ncbi:MAG: DNA topoisomerase IB, partial [Chthoniobacterales bacterium]
MAGKSRKRSKVPKKLADLDIVTDPPEAAAEAGLRYVTDDAPGFTRKPRGKGFAYFDTRGKEIRDEKRLLRLRRLAIPPAYKDVWIAPQENSHLQATGCDDRGRKQYRYHEKWREVRDESKYERMV